eukprot:6492717-Amphidinium_carterae.2
MGRGGKGAFSNNFKSCGVEILLRRSRFKPRHVKKIWSAPANMQGRVGALRLKSSLFDFTVFTVYAPPEPQSDKGKAVTEAVWRFVEEVLAELPDRTVPIILCDANGHVGQDTAKMAQFIRAQHLSASGTLADSWRTTMELGFVKLLKGMILLFSTPSMIVGLHTTLETGCAAAPLIMCACLLLCGLARSRARFFFEPATDYRLWLVKDAETTDLSQRHSITAPGLG